jgi:hypothetical protein
MKGNPMAAKRPLWKRGRGKLGILTPLMGTWIAEAPAPAGSGLGKIRCTRSFTPALGGRYVQLVARWEFGKGVYEELAVFGVSDGKIAFWSFTSDGKRSEGVLVDGKDVHPESVAFQARMPAGIARMIYWPDEEKGFHWAVESKTKTGWNRFTQHHYLPAST